MQRTVAIAGLVAALLVMGAGVALAGVSDGNYRPERQHCSGDADQNEQSDRAQPGCQNFALNVSDGNGNEPADVGTEQTPDGTTVHKVIADVDAGSGFDPTTGTRLYLGADDNLDGGEHDGSNQINDGPSDGGAVVFNVDPNSITTWFGALMSGDSQYLLTHPLPLVDAGFGSCADGVCESIQTQRRTAYQGGGQGERDVANYDGKQWDPESCSSADDDPASCPRPDSDPRPAYCNSPAHSADRQCDQGLKYWHDQAGTAYVEPGVQVYEDPNPAASPIGPYPLPAFYAGTCGVIVGGGPMAQMPASPITNSAGQFVVQTQC